MSRDPVSFTVNFLTLPLAPAYPEQTVDTIRTTLLKEFQALREDQVARSSEWQIYLSLSTSALLPPRPFLAACVASGIQWPRWVQLLGGKDMMFGLSAKAVVVAYPKLQSFVTLWQAPMSKEEDQDLKALQRWEKWLPPTPSSSGCRNPEDIPVSAPLSCAIFSAQSDVWRRPDSPSRDSVWSDSDDELDEWEREVQEVHSSEESD